MLVKADIAGRARQAQEEEPIHHGGMGGGHMSASTFAPLKHYEPCVYYR